MRTKFSLVALLLIGISISYSFIRHNNSTINPFLVVLDAGHGGYDSGNRGLGYIEKDIALDVTLQVGKILEKDPDFEVIYTRKKDIFLELHERAAIANDKDANVFVSIISAPAATYSS